MSHLEGTTYLKHFKRSIGFFWSSTKASWCFLIHAFFPEFLTEAGSSIINEMDFSH